MRAFGVSASAELSEDLANRFLILIKNVCSVGANHMIPGVFDEVSTFDSSDAGFAGTDDASATFSLGPSPSLESDTAAPYGT